jgi:hypothetical protein
MVGKEPIKPARTRGKSKKPNRKPSEILSVCVLEVDASNDSSMRRSFEKMWSAAYTLRRALQRDARKLVRVYWASSLTRAGGPRPQKTRLKRH